ncbi:MAG: tRNA dihydrouridine synthase DusB [candidate division Zixibacteria bacterium RBG_16_43_9]|nr:MAG: tRNA dihydrouridine synthase DusB [candidate division Zixibacteria bacterium RBG_16_43_9]
MKLGNLNLSGRVILAPMAGVTDSSFRILARSFGACLTYTEMISSDGLIRQNTNSLRLLYFKEEERPIGIQLYGSDPEKLASAAKIVERLKPDLIDLNFACPVKKVTKKNGGAAVLKDLGLLKKIVSSVTKSVSLPVTLKIRSGWDSENIVALEVAKIAEDCGVSAITIHPRTGKSMFRGKANWDIIGEVKSKVNLTILGSGDIFSPQNVKEMIDSTGCDGVMVGRGALGNLWIFQRSNYYLESDTLLPDPSAEEIVSLALRHLQLSIADRGEYWGIMRMRKHLLWYIKKLPGNQELRKNILSTEKFEDLKRAFEYYLFSNTPLSERKIGAET